MQRCVLQWAGNGYQCCAYSETDQYREGVFLATDCPHRQTTACPVNYMIWKYFSMVGLFHTSDKLFRAIVSNKTRVQV